MFIRSIKTLKHPYEQKSFKVGGCNVIIPFGKESVSFRLTFNKILWTYYKMVTTCNKKMLKNPFIYFKKCRFVSFHFLSYILIWNNFFRLNCFTYKVSIDKFIIEFQAERAEAPRNINKLKNVLQVSE